MHNFCAVTTSAHMSTPPHGLYLISCSHAFIPTNHLPLSHNHVVSCGHAVISLSYHVISHTVVNLVITLSHHLIQVVTPSTHVVTPSPMFISMVTPSHFGHILFHRLWSHLPPSPIVMPSPAYLQ